MKSHGHLLSVWCPSGYSQVTTTCRCTVDLGFRFSSTVFAGHKWFTTAGKLGQTSLRCLSSRAVTDAHPNATSRGPTDVGRGFSTIYQISRAREAMNVSCRIAASSVGSLIFSNFSCRIETALSRGSTSSMHLMRDYRRCHIISREALPKLRYSSDILWIERLPQTLEQQSFSHAHLRHASLQGV